MGIRAAGMGTVTMLGMSQVSACQGFSCPALNSRMTLPRATRQAEKTCLLSWNLLSYPPRSLPGSFMR